MPPGSEAYQRERRKVCVYLQRLNLASSSPPRLYRNQACRSIQTIERLGPHKLGRSARACPLSNSPSSRNRPVESK